MHPKPVRRGRIENNSERTVILRVAGAAEIKPLATHVRAQLFGELFSVYLHGRYSIDYGKAWPPADRESIAQSGVCLLGERLVGRRYFTGAMAAMELYSDVELQR